LPHVAGMFVRKMGDAGSSRSLRSCAPWQSVQVADLFSPFSTIARLWMLFSYMRAAPGIGMPDRSATSRLPWHLVHVAARFRK